MWTPLILTFSRKGRRNSITNHYAISYLGFDLVDLREQVFKFPRTRNTFTFFSEVPPTRGSL
jgi:hypothetical protein